MRYGIRSISMDEIAAQLGISKKTIYQFFADKDSLVDAVVDTEINNNAQECLNYSARSENPVHEFLLAIDMLLEMLRIMNPMFIYELQKYHPTAFKKISDHKQGFLGKLIKENLEQGIKLELYRPEINVHILSNYRLASIFLVFNPELFPLGKYNMGEALSEITLNFLYGITTPKGQKLIQKINQQRLKRNQHEDKAN